MVSNKSLDEVEIIAALLRDVRNVHGLVFNTRSLNLTVKKVKSRFMNEGMGFLTKTLPRLGKAFDKALTGHTKLNSTEHGFDSMPGSQLPRFLGELFQLVFQQDGSFLPNPCPSSVRVIRDVLYCFYKYELPYTDEQEQQVVQKFERTEDDLEQVDHMLRELYHETRGHADPPSQADQVNSQNEIGTCVPHSSCDVPDKPKGPEGPLVSGLTSSARQAPVRDPLRARRIRVLITRRAQGLLNKLFARFDPLDIHPRHGPGAVATKQQLSDKYLWTNVASRITDLYPFDAYFCASLGHVCDSYHTFSRVAQESLPARVVLVPKDSRGPRLISCEPVDYQWIQQGLGRGIVQLVESHPLTKGLVNFTYQYPNRCGALWGSQTGRYSTLDLHEASDRISTELVRLLFPERIFTYLDACRSSSTELPDGRVIRLRKFAPMGSSLCFPILALTIWAILTAAAPDQYTKDRILVYGDDVIVPTDYSANAIEHLESFGLKINRDKSCTSGLFRESCGMDAFQGTCVTPVRLRTVWSSEPRPDVYSSWIAYANLYWDRRYYHVYNYIVDRLVHIYGPIPSKDMHLACPSLWSVPDSGAKLRRRTNKDLQKSEYLVYDVKSPSITKVMDGWSMLLRFFAESTSDSVMPLPEVSHSKPETPLMESRAFSVSQYTKRRTSMLVRRWR